MGDNWWTRSWENSCALKRISEDLTEEPDEVWPMPVSDEQAIFYALSTIASWQTWCETGGPSLEDATRLVVRRIAEAREACGVIDA